MIVSDISCRILVCTSNNDVYRIVDVALNSGEIVEIKERKKEEIEVKVIKKVGDYYEE